MAVDMFVAVCKPLLYKRVMNKCLGIVVTCIIWTATLLMFIATCSFMTIVAFLVMLIFYCATSCVVVVVIVILYSLVFKTLRNRLRPLGRFTRKNRKAALTIFLIVSTYISFMLPAANMYIASGIVYLLTDSFSNSFHVNSVLLILSQVNCICDPLIYATRFPKVKKFFTARRLLKSRHVRDLKQPKSTNLR